ncbi:MAG TPA: outer membrane lipoprotein-sorting protein [Blastocatellia bacterium]
MKRSGIMLTAMLVVIQTASYAFAAPVAELDTILANMQKAGAGLTSIQTKFHEDRRFGSIGGGEQYDGQIYFRHGAKSADKIRVQSLKGSTVTEDLWVNGNDAFFYQPQAHQVIITTTNKQAADHPEYGFVANPYVSVPKLKAQYDISYLGDESLPSGSKAAVLQLIPKTKSAVTKLVIWVDRQSWLPVKYQTNQSNGDTLTYTLGVIAVDKKIPDDTFKPVWPHGTNVIHQ